MANEAGNVIAGLHDPLEGIAGCQILMLKARGDLPSLTYVSSVISRKRMKQRKNSDEHFQNRDSFLKGISYIRYSINRSRTRPFTLTLPIIIGIQSMWDRGPT